MDIMKFIEEKLEDPEIIGKLSKSLNADSDKVKNAAKLSVPTMMQGLAENAKSSQGRESLGKALDSHKGDNIKDIKKYLNNVNKNEGDKIVTHILGTKKTNVQSGIAKKSGLEGKQVSSLMSQLAPLLLGALGQEKKSGNLGSNDIGALLGKVLGGTDNGTKEKISKLLDKKGDKNIMDDVSKIGGKLFKK